MRAPFMNAQVHKQETVASQPPKKPASREITKSVAASAPVASIKQTPVVSDVEEEEIAAPKQTAATLPKVGSTKLDLVTPSPVKRPEKPQLASSTSTPVHKQEPIAARTVAMQSSRTSETLSAQPINNHVDTAFTKLADGFDFPVGKPD